jgi:hypothetical protein
MSAEFDAPSVDFLSLRLRNPTLGVLGERT